MVAWHDRKRKKTSANISAPASCPIWRVGPSSDRWDARYQAPAHYTPFKTITWADCHYRGLTRSRLVLNAALSCHFLASCVNNSWFA